MNKLQRYNLWVLAIIGSIALLFTIGGSLAVLVELADDFFDDDDDFQQGVVVDDPVVNNHSDPLPIQEVSIMEPTQLDTAKAQFIIPVGLVNTGEEIVEETPVSLNIGSYKRSESYYRSYYGMYYNFIYYDDKSSQKKALFDKKVAIRRWMDKKSENRQVLLFIGTDEDSNGDSYMNEDDDQDLFVYYLDEGIMKHYDFGNMSVSDVGVFNKTEKMYIKLRNDLNGDGKFNSNKEPMDLMVLDLASKETEPFVSDQLRAQVEELIKR